MKNELRLLGHEVSVRTLDEVVPGAAETWVIIPDREALGMTPDELKDLFRAAPGPVVLVSSAAVFEPNHHHPGMVSESGLLSQRLDNPITRRWRELEEAVRETGDSTVVVLRPPAIPLPGGRDFFSRLFQRSWATVLAGYDPPMQFMGPRDLALAVSLAARRGESGVFNLAPSGVIPLREALRLAGVRAVPVPRWLHRLARGLSRLVSLRVDSIDRLDFIRYSWTVSGAHASERLGFRPTESSLRVIAPDAEDVAFDDFGLRPRYIERWSRTALTFLYRFFWRVEVDGLEHVSREGPVVMAGTHRGWVPMDAVIVVHDVLRHRGRIPRFLVHPGLLKFPFFFDFIIRFGGVIACRENAERILSDGGVLAVFPEGVGGPFRLYRDAYRLGRFGNDVFLRAALRHRAPIVPFVTVGSAESFPIVARIDWRWWKRWAEWPFLPVSPTLLPLPLPAKWHTRYLPPMPEASGLSAEAANDPETLRALRRALRRTLADQMETIRRARPGIFHGSAFDRERPASSV